MVILHQKLREKPFYREVVKVALVVSQVPLTGGVMSTLTVLENEDSEWRD